MSDRPVQTEGSSRSLFFLVTAAFGGLGLALWSALGEPAFAPGADVTASAYVNDRPILTREVDRAVAAMASDKRNPVTAQDRERALQTLIREEVLVQRGLELGLAQSDQVVRNTIVAAMVQKIIANADIEDPSEETLRAFYADNPRLIPARTLVRIQHFSLPLAGDGARERAAQIADQLQSGVSFADVVKDVEQDAASYVPGSWLSLEQLKGYLGAGLTDIVAAMRPTEIAGPLSARGAAHFVWLIDRRDTPSPPFETAKAEIAQEWRRRQEELAVARYLETLKKRARIDVPDPGGGAE